MSLLLPNGLSLFLGLLLFPSLSPIYLVTPVRNFWFFLHSKDFLVQCYGSTVGLKVTSQDGKAVKAFFAAYCSWKQVYCKKNYLHSFSYLHIFLFSGICSKLQTTGPAPSTKQFLRATHTQHNVAVPALPGESFTTVCMSPASFCGHTT